MPVSLSGAAVGTAWFPAATDMTRVTSVRPAAPPLAHTAVNELPKPSLEKGPPGPLLVGSQSVDWWLHIPCLTGQHAKKAAWIVVQWAWSTEPQRFSQRVQRLLLDPHGCHTVTMGRVCRGCMGRIHRRGPADTRPPIAKQNTICLTLLCFILGLPHNTAQMQSPEAPQQRHPRGGPRRRSP